ncbi:hypothetical protein ABCR94_23390 [Streptomyces sp. 21So2-11]|uniref:hypothetical protein n=1 Tax=Streptomyces sp. 21So2-11 TaxID=3144408 RepID=UPI00321A6439
MAFTAPVISLSADRLSGAVGATADPVVTVTVSQHGAAPGDLSVAAVGSSDTFVAGAGDVTVGGRGATRRISVRARGVGYCDLTLRVTGLGGRMSATTLHYAASGPVRHAADTRYFTHACDASAAVDVGDGHVVVADDETNVLRLYPRGASGGPVRTWDFSAALGVGKEVDIEGAARAGDVIHWTGSMSNAKDGKLRADRSSLFTTTVRGFGASTELDFEDSYGGLRDDLIAWDERNGGELGFAAGAAKGRPPKRIDGFNVEGFEFAPGNTGTAYLGFRAPLVPAKPGGGALLVPVTNADVLAAGGGPAEFGERIVLDLGGLSIRDLRKNSADQYLIVAGSWAADDNTDPYALYSWDGVPGHAPVRVMDLPTCDPGGWECVVDVPDLEVPGARVQLITDSGSADWYGDGTEAKDLPHPELKKTRAVWFTVTE